MKSTSLSKGDGNFADMCCMAIIFDERLARRSCNQRFVENILESNLCFAWTTALEFMRQIPGFPVMQMKYSDCWTNLFSMNASNSHGEISDFNAVGSQHPKLKMGRYPGNPGHCMISLLPPAGMVEQVSMARSRVSHSLGTVTVSGLFRMCCMSQNDWVSA